MFYIHSRSRYTSTTALLCALVTSPALLILAPTTSFAYEQTMTCSNNAGAMFPCGANESPLPVCWSERSINYVINSAGSDDLRMDDGSPLSLALEEAVQGAFAAWTGPECSNISITYNGTTEDNRVGYFKDGKDTNLIIWQEEWPYADTSAYALTSVTFSASDGSISDADIELNGEFFTWSTKEIPGPNEVDLRNTLTHEIGHFIGFDHSSLPEATMFASAPLGETSKRTLAEDDLDGVCAVYTPQEESGCGNCSQSTTGSPPLPWSFILVLSLLYSQRRRRKHT